METIDCSPTPEGYLEIARFLRMGIDCSPEILRSYVEILVYLSHKHPELYDKFMNPLGK